MTSSPYPRAVYLRNAKIYKVLSNPVRLEILNVIRNNEACVEDLSQVLKLRKANISQQLALLRYVGLVKSRKEGQRVYYHIAHPNIVEPCCILKDLWEQNVFGKE